MFCFQSYHGSSSVEATYLTHLEIVGFLTLSCIFYPPEFERCLQLSKNLHLWVTFNRGVRVVKPWQTRNDPELLSLDRQEKEVRSVLSRGLLKNSALLTITWQSQNGAIRKWSNWAVNSSTWRKLRSRRETDFLHRLIVIKQEGMVLNLKRGDLD